MLQNAGEQGMVHDPVQPVGMLHIQMMHGGGRQANNVEGGGMGKEKGNGRRAGGNSKR